ncbi:MAG: FixH family protein [Sulfuricurvum sp.]|uniref:FixH family protein n=1 Tax=Sulfuricurvum sp. TaxID=2025608 RepID=UPI002615D14C|nr:FixH family protein [Sulfuricurvum sp.]MDD5160158.1 FixH family protein [Sulfuricurvum sp.]
MKFKFILLTVLFASLAFGAAWEQSTSMQNIKAVVSSDKPLIVGSNAVMITLNQQNLPLDNAGVEVKAFMPSMPGMPAMESKAKAVAQGHGVYKTSVNLDMGGTWQFHIFVTTKEGKKYRLKTSLSL